MVSTSDIYEFSFQMTLFIISSNVTFNGITKIIGNNNSGKIAKYTRLIFEDDVLFNSNISPNGGALNCLQGILFFKWTYFSHITEQIMMVELLTLLAH